MEIEHTIEDRIKALEVQVTSNQIIISALFGEDHMRKQIEICRRAYPWIYEEEFLGTLSAKARKVLTGDVE